MDCAGSGREPRGDAVRGWPSQPTQTQIPIYTHLQFKRDRHMSLLRQQPRPMSEADR